VISSEHSVVILSEAKDLPDERPKDLSELSEFSWLAARRSRP
jgi:hypothetical protein